MLVLGSVSYAQIQAQGIFFTCYQVSVKQIPFDYQAIFLQNEFGKAKILNPYIIPRGIEPVEIEVIFSKYPQDTTGWLLRLLNQRLQELFAIKPEWKKLPIQWKIVLQTECSTYRSAKSLPHGFWVKYDRPLFDPDFPILFSQNSSAAGGNSNSRNKEENLASRSPNNQNTGSITLPGILRKKEKVNIEFDSRDQGSHNAEITEEKSDIPDPQKVRRTDRGSSKERQEENIDKSEKEKVNSKKIEEKNGKKLQNVKFDTVDTESLLDTTNNKSRTQDIFKQSGDKNRAQELGTMQKKENDDKNNNKSGPDDNQHGRGADYAYPNFPTTSKTSKNQENNSGFESNFHSQEEYKSTAKADEVRKQEQRQEQRKVSMPLHQQRSYDYLGLTEEEKVKIRKELVRQSMDMVRQIIDGSYPLPPQDSVVLKTFARHPEWKELMVVTDWTGSMYQYGAQVVKWHKDNLERGTIKHLVFFNDGDDYEKSYSSLGQSKKMGETGGVYFCTPSDIEEVIRTMEMVMLKGDGGEIPENDIEAILKGMEHFKGQYSSIVLIADNASEVRDINLLYKLKQPVHVIICGDATVVHPDYVAIAWKTGGSIMTIDYEVIFKAPQKPLKRNTIKVGKNKYILTSPLGRFELKSNTTFWDNFKNSKKIRY
ncbi:MAG: hypothetical protein RML72_08665 [Bacteroidia bacterium]|nr:hypothetical protein [Bacteroidia bacterium]MDW8158926.1 hypothetical protein [Bacteroidia bacterium]